MKRICQIVAVAGACSPSLFVAAGCRRAAAATKQHVDTYRQLNLFGDVFERVRADYVEKVADEKLIESAINGMLTSLDPHSSYMDAKNFRDMQVQTKRRVRRPRHRGHDGERAVKVVSPIDDTPAAKAGIKPGDLIIADRRRAGAWA